MNKLYSIILLCLTLNLYSCFGGGDDDPCPNGNSDHDKYVYIATARVSYSSYNSIKILKDTFSLQNNKSFLASYQFIDSTHWYDKIKLEQFSTNEKLQCGYQTTVPCYKTEGVQRNYSSKDIAIKIAYVVSKNSKLPRPATSVQDTDLANIITDIQSVTINGYQFSLTTPNEILDSVIIINKTYKNVIHSFYSSDYLSHHPGVIPAGIYFQNGKGIVGYYLSNGEKWER